MAKESEKRLAKEHFLKGKSQKECAAIASIQEKTMGIWIKKYGWRQERDAKINSTKSQIENLKVLIGKLTEQRITLIREIENAEIKGDLEKVSALQSKASRLSSEVANYNKTLLTLDQENKISLADYLEVMSKIFTAVQKYDSNLYMKLLDFQEEHLTEISLKLG